MTRTLIIRLADNIVSNDRRIGFRFLLFLLLSVTATLTACIPDDASGPDSCERDGSLLYDDFEGDQDCGWILFNERGIRTEITDGVLRISNASAGELSWTNADRNFDDVIITVEARQVGGPDNNAYGVICRYQSAENFYVFLISGDGYFAIGKYQSNSDQVQYLTGDGQYLASEVINQGAAANEIRASCIDNELTLAVNGIPLVTVTDPTFVTGDIGLGANTFDPGTAIIEFDEIRVLAP